MNNAIWFTWENQIRNKSMSSLLGAKLYVITYSGNRLLRYIYCMVSTLRILLKERPKYVFAQNPSILLIYFLLSVKILLRYKLISDAHYVGVISSDGRLMYQKILNLCNRMVDLVIVTNQGHKDYIHKNGGRAVICEDPLPDIIDYYTDETNDEKMVYYICSFDFDEPYDVAFNAAKSLIEHDYKIYVTGNYRRVNINPMKYPHITFLGYIQLDQYYNNLFKCNVVLDLTENENCLVCGAYEAMAAEKPLVTSDSTCLRSYFTKGTVFTKHDEDSIANAIEGAYRDRNILKDDIRQWKDEIKNRQEKNMLNIWNMLGISTNV